MKRLLILFFIVPLLCFGQNTKTITDFQTYSGNPAGGWVWVVLNNTSRKVDAALMGYNKIEIITVTQGTLYDTLNVWKNGAIAYKTLTRAGGAFSSGYGIIVNQITGKIDLDTSQNNTYFSKEFVKIADTLYSPTVIGSATRNGDGGSSNVNIPHGLGYTPAWYSVTPTSFDAAGYQYVTADNTNIIVHYATARPAGTGNLQYNWTVKR